MTHRTPPTLATSLLKMFGADSALVGDLGEGYESGKSRWWYWQQVLAIIAASTETEVRRHPIITMRAIAFGFAFTWVIWHAYVMWAVLNYDEVLFRTGLLPWFYTHGLAVPRTAIFPATVLLYGLSGWIVGRTSRDSAAVVLVYAGVGELLFFADFGMWRFIYDPLPYSVMAILTITVRPIPALLGGLWAVSQRHPAKRHFDG
jgi:hypothetical protein